MKQAEAAHARAHARRQAHAPAADLLRRHARRHDADA